MIKTRLGGAATGMLASWMLWSLVASAVFMIHGVVPPVFDSLILSSLWVVFLTWRYDLAKVVLVVAVLIGSAILMLVSSSLLVPIDVAHAWLWCGIVSTALVLVSLAAREIARHTARHSTDSATQHREEGRA